MCFTSFFVPRLGYFSLLSASFFGHSCVDDLCFYFFCLALFHMLIAGLLFLLLLSLAKVRIRSKGRQLFLCCCFRGPLTSASLYSCCYSLGYSLVLSSKSLIVPIAASPSPTPYDSRFFAAPFLIFYFVTLRIRTLLCSCGLASMLPHRICLNLFEIFFLFPLVQL